MTVLQTLDQYYSRMARRGDAELLGYSRKSIDLCIWLNIDGSIANVADLNDYSGNRPVPRRIAVPKEVIRTSGVASNFLWDKTEYTLGIGKAKDKKYNRIYEKEHEEFKRLHRERLANTNDAGLRALLAFLSNWTPSCFAYDSRFTADMLNKNVVFGLVGGPPEYLHERVAAQTFITAACEVWKMGFCLVSGTEAPIKRLHPIIEGVYGAHSSGARLVSFNSDAFTSYGAKNGANAPTSELVAFRYGTALNRLLDRDSTNRINIGDATVAFWADAEAFGEAAALGAERLFVNLVKPPGDDREAQKMRRVLDCINAGRPLQEIDPQLQPQTQLYILGLSPNAARLSVRYWIVDEFGNFARKLATHYQDIDIEPRPWGSIQPSISRLLVKTAALQEEFESIPPLLAGEFTRSVLEGLAYPRTLLAAALMRLRAGDRPHTGWHAAVIKGCLNRNRGEKEQLPVARNIDYYKPAYQLGRLLAVLEAAQYAALGPLYASIVDRYYGAASTTPARVFPPLLSKARHNLVDAKKRGKGKWIEARLNEIFSKLPPDMPQALKLEDQGRFAVGYYHERAWRGSDAAQELETAEERTGK